ncbi:hypothetical protein [Mongoliitalea lutea]|uniref:hypothetical protein n=1 Tax=Mongoliitalea lutea TaxID=849756 RepID=UPI00167981D5|nr:hypothetical protein [Mongoliitalea lutea]
MRKLTFLIVLGSLLMAFPLPSQKVQADPLITAGVTLATGLAVYVDKGCDKQRENGTLQNRCKNGVCGPVACISFRPTCSGQC